MRLLFKLNINDKYNPRKVYLAGQEYEVDDKRGKELLKAFPKHIARVDKPVRNSNPTRNANEDSRSDKDNDEQTDQDAPVTNQDNNEDNAPTENQHAPDKDNGDVGSPSEK